MATLAGATATRVNGADTTGRFQVGEVRGPDERQREVLWQNGTPSDLGLPAGYYAGAVNDSGQVIGDRMVGGSLQGWRRGAGAVVDLPTPKSALAARTSYINTRGQIVGVAYYAENNWDARGVVWSPDDDVRVLARPTGFNEASVTGIDEDGTVVGTVTDWDYDGAVARSQRAVVWFADGSWQFLPTAHPDERSEGRAIRHGLALGMDGDTAVAWNVGSGDLGTPIAGTGELLDVNANGSVLRGLLLIQPGGVTRTLPFDDPADGAWAVRVTDGEQVYGTDAGGSTGPIAVRWDCT